MSTTARFLDIRMNLTIDQRLWLNTEFGRYPCKIIWYRWKSEGKWDVVFEKEGDTISSALREISPGRLTLLGGRSGCLTEN